MTQAEVSTVGSSSSSEGFSLTQQQVEQLLKLLPQSQQHSIKPPSYDTEEELEQNFAGSAFFSCAVIRASEWIINIRATDHMTVTT